MMSKERELLIRARDVLRGLKGTHYDLYWDIQELLDKPEQEPLSEDEIAELWWNTYVVGTADSVRNFARAIETRYWR